jgi:hypothetical protein
MHVMAAPVGMVMSPAVSLVRCPVAVMRPLVAGVVVHLVRSVCPQRVPVDSLGPVALQMPCVAGPLALVPLVVQRRSGAVAVVLRLGVLDRLQVLQMPQALGWLVVALLVAPLGASLPEMAVTLRPMRGSAMVTDGPGPPLLAVKMAVLRDRHFVTLCRFRDHAGKG